LLGQGLHKQAVWLRAAGALIAAGGVWMMAMSWWRGFDFT